MATTSSCLPTRSRASEVARFPMLRQQEPIADGRPNRSLADFVAPASSSGARLPGRLRGDRGPRRRRPGRPLRGRPRRLPRHHGEGAGRSPGRGLRRVPARAGAPRLGLRRGRTAVERRSRSPRSIAASGRRSAIRRAPITREKGQLFDLLGAEHAGLEPHRALRDDAGGQRQRPLLRESRRRGTSWSAGSGPTR